MADEDGKRPEMAGRQGCISCSAAAEGPGVCEPEQRMAAAALLAATANLSSAAPHVSTAVMVDNTRRVQWYQASLRASATGLPLQLLGAALCCLGLSGAMEAMQCNAHIAPGVGVGRVEGRRLLEGR